MLFSARAPVIGSVACHSILRWHRQNALCTTPPVCSTVRTAHCGFATAAVTAHGTRRDVVHSTTRCPLFLSCLRIFREVLFFSLPRAGFVSPPAYSLVTNKCSPNYLMPKKTTRSSPAVIRHDYPVAVHPLVRYAQLHACLHPPHHFALSCLVYRHMCLPLAANAAQLHRSLHCNSHHVSRVHSLTTERQKLRR
jgi:hypothetical protein